MNSLTFPLLRTLSDGQFHSGQALARQLGVSRATIWNAIQYAETLGVEVFSVRGRGYKLPQPISLLNLEAIQAQLGELATLYTLELHDVMDSTNSYLMKQANAATPYQQGKSASHATCVVAELQTQGRGRRGRSWQAGLGASLTFSVLWRFAGGASSLSGLSLAVGVALIRAMRSLGLNSAALKWPNDVVVAPSGKASEGVEKLAGILIELQGDMEGPSAAVIGIGINLALPDAVRDQIDQPVTDWHRLTGEYADASRLLGECLKQLAWVLQTFEQQGFEALRAEWQLYHAYHQQAVRLLMPDQRELQGVATGVAMDGALMVHTTQGEQRFSAGEISMRGLA